MSGGGFRRLPIVDEAGSVHGVLKVSGLLHYLVEHFPKIVHTLPPESSLEEAALLEPTAVVVHGFLRAQPRAGDTVVVIGDGNIGLLAVQVARLFSQIQAANIETTEFSQKLPTLDDVFLKIINENEENK